jgi:hypothetical protein
VISRILEERFAIDQQLAAYPRRPPNTLTNTVVANSYIWNILADETSKKSSLQGAGAQALVSAMAALLDDVAAIVNPPQSTGAATPSSSAGTPPGTLPTGSGKPAQHP